MEVVVRQVDLYSGFEGHAEVIITCVVSGAVTVRVVCWSGWIHMLLEPIPSAPEGWTGLLRWHHLDQGWVDDPWVDPDLGATEALLARALEGATEDGAKRAGEQLLEVVREARREGGQVHWLEQ